MRDWSDEKLIERLATEPAAAGRALYDRYAGMLLRFLYRFTGNGQAAEEILHDVFLELLRGNFRDLSQGGLKPWLFTVARNRALNARRRAGRELSGAEALEEAAGPEDLEADTERRLDLDRLERAARRLPAELLEAWRLRRSGLGYQEIADQLAVPLGTVKSRFHRLVAFLKEDWEK